MAAFGGLIAKGGGAIANVDQNLQIWGLYHLTGETVSVAILGLDLGDFTVATDGSVTVSLVATVNQTSAWSAAQLIAADSSGYGENATPISVKNGGAAVQATVPIVVGSPYVTQGQRLRPVTQDDAKAHTGAVLGAVRIGYQHGTLIQNAVVAQFGTVLTPSPLGNMDQAVFTDSAGTALASGVAFSGVFWGILPDAIGFDSMFCWQVVRPYPCTIVSNTMFLTTSER